MLKQNKLPDHKDTLINKLYSIDSNYLELSFNRISRRAKACNDACTLLDMVSGWMGDDKEFALGTDTYTLADVIVTVFLARLSFCTAFMEKEIQKSRPNIWRYWQRMQARPSYNSIYVIPVQKASTLTFSLGFMLLSTILGSLAFGISCLFTKKPEWEYLPMFAGGFFCTIVAAFAILGCKMRS